MKKLILAVPLAAVLAVSMIVVPSAFASSGLAKDNPDFDITDVNKFRMTVAGTAGGTVPADQRHVYAYVFVLSTSDETTLRGYAVTSHHPEDSTEVDDDINWHAHYVEVTENCVSKLTEEGNAKLSGDKVSVTGAKGTVIAGALVVLQINTGTGSVCVEEIVDFQAA